MEYVSLHHHSTMSFMDGFGTPAEHVERAAELGMEALALTEHGNTASHVQLERAANKVGIKPIFGLEAYTAPADMRETKNQRKWHLTILATNQLGYRNLNRLVTRSWDEGFYRWPTISGQMLAEHNEGLIVLSGCADSKIACDLLGGKGRETGNEQDALASIDRFRSIFGDRFFLEVQQFPELGRTRLLISWYGEVSQRLGIPLVATSDCHYPRPADNEMQKILHAAGRNTGTVAAAEAEWEYDILLTMPESDRAIWERLKATGLTGPQAEAAVRNTAEVAARCDVTLPKADLLRFPLPPGETSISLITRWLNEGWHYRLDRNKRMQENPDEYISRVKYELGIITEKDFVDYFLMLSDVVRAAKDSGIPVGPARGSAAASLVCYLLRITEVDPLQFPTMVFERFIDITREDMPDVDLDFDDGRRHEVREHLVRRYGADRVGNIGNFIRYRGKNAVVDVSRVYQIPEKSAKVVKDLIIERSGGDSRFDASLEDTRDTFPQAGAVFEEYPELNNAIRLEGNYKGMSVHAAGIVIANAPINDTCALLARETGKDRRKVSVLPYDKYDVEYLGMLKADFLGLTTMGMIAICLELSGLKLEDLYDIPLDDEETIDAFRKGDVIGIFQFEGRATRLVNNDVKPDNFMELSDINALSRPGPLFSGQTAAYIDIKHGRKKPEMLHPVVDEITSISKYQMIYQEQILKIVREVGGFPWTHAAEIRKIISKKKGEAAFNVMVDRFIQGAKDLHGINPDLALKIWKFMVTSGTYSFNVAHSVSYSMLAFWQMWLKKHYPVEFYTASLRKGSEEHAEKLMRDAERHGVKVRPPDLNRSGITWGMDRDNNEVLAGYEQIKGIGEKMANTIINDREANGPFTGWADLSRVKGIGPKKVEQIQGMAENDDPFGLEVAGKMLTEIRGMIRRKELPLPLPTYRSDEIPTEADNLLVTWIGVVKARNFQDYIENQRARTGDDSADILARTKDPHLLTSAVLHCYDDGDEDVYLRFNRWVFPKFKQAIESLQMGRHVVVAKGVKRKGFGVAVHVKEFYVIDPYDEEEEDGSATEDAA